jgi:hypothetical protein
LKSPSASAAWRDFPSPRPRPSGTSAPWRVRTERCVWRVTSLKSTLRLRRVRPTRPGGSDEITLEKLFGTTGSSTDSFGDLVGTAVAAILSNTGYILRNSREPTTQKSNDPVFAQMISTTSRCEHARLPRWGSVRLGNLSGEPARRAALVSNPTGFCGWACSRIRGVEDMSVGPHYRRQLRRPLTCLVGTLPFTSDSGRMLASRALAPSSSWGCQPMAGGRSTWLNVLSQEAVKGRCL